MVADPCADIAYIDIYHKREKKNPFYFFHIVCINLRTLTHPQHLVFHLCILEIFYAIPISKHLLIRQKEFFVILRENMFIVRKKFSFFFFPSTYAQLLFVFE